MPLADDQKRSRAEQEYQFLATLLRSPEKLPLVVKRLDAARFDVPVIAQIVKAIAESYDACGSLSLDDVRSRLNPLENAEVDTVIAYSTVLADDAEILAVLDRKQPMAAGEAPPAGAERPQDAAPKPTLTNVRRSHPRAASRAQIEEMVLASLLSNRIPDRAVMDGLRPDLFESEQYGRIAAILVNAYRQFGQFYPNDVESRARGEDKRAVVRLWEQEDVLPDGTDLLALLAGTQIPAISPRKERSRRVCAPLTEYEAEARRWLWPDRMELGRLILIGGEVGSGKSLVACDLAARTTTGGPWPDGAAPLTPGSVLLVAPGDDVSDQIRPRLEAAGADIERIHVLAVDPLAPARREDRDSPFQARLNAIEGALEELVDCRLVVIDPLRLSIGRTATAIEGDPKARLELLASLARRQQVTVLAVAIAAYEDRRRSMSSDALRLATAGCAATSWQVVRHPHLKRVRLFLPGKTTRSSDLEGLAFTISDELAGERVSWQEQRVPCDGISLSLGDGAGYWLRQALAEGRLPAKELFELAARNGYTPRMLHLAKPKAGVTIVREGFGPGAAWHWMLGTPDHAQHAQVA